MRSFLGGNDTDIQGLVGAGHRTYQLHTRNIRQNPSLPSMVFVLDKTLRPVWR